MHEQCKIYKYFASVRYKMFRLTDCTLSSGEYIIENERIWQLHNLHKLQ